LFLHCFEQITGHSDGPNAGSEGGKMDLQPMANEEN
jgi:hypothetical protein